MNYSISSNLSLKDIFLEVRIWQTVLLLDFSASNISFILNFILEVLEILTRPLQSIIKPGENVEEIETAKESSIDLNIESHEEGLIASNSDHTEEDDFSGESDSFGEESCEDESEYNESENYEKELEINPLKTEIKSSTINNFIENKGRNYENIKSKVLEEDCETIELLKLLYSEICEYYQRAKKNFCFSSDDEDNFEISDEIIEKKDNMIDLEHHLFLDDITEETKGDTNFFHNFHVIGSKDFVISRENKSLDDGKKEFSPEIVYFNKELNLQFNKQNAEKIIIFSNKQNLEQGISYFKDVQEENNLLEKILKSFFLVHPLNISILTSLLLNLSESIETGSKIINGLLSLLLPLSSNSNIFSLESSQYFEFYPLSSFKILEILQHMVALNPRISILLLSNLTFKELIMSKFFIIEISGFEVLFNLLEENFYRVSIMHLNALLSLISNIISKLGLKMPDLNQNALDNLCKLFLDKELNRKSIYLIIDIINKLYKIPNLKPKINDSLNKQLSTLANELSLCLINIEENNSNGIKEQQFLRICKLIKNIHGHFNDIDYL